MALQLQWGFEETSSSTLSLAKDIVRAATTDNVNPLALLACERFGNTIAMSPETIRKIERSVVPSPPPAIIHFLKSSVGYSANDSITRLGETMAGLQFLALASALTATMSSFKASAAISAMLMSTASDKTLLPPSTQIRQLLDIIEPKCHKSGFADDVAGWEILLNNARTTKFQTGVESTTGISGHPDSKGMENLVNSLRQLHRIGNEDISNVTIRNNRCAAWITAFVKWSLGYPPSILFEDGTPVLEQAGSEVTLVISNDPNPLKIEITIHSSISNPSILVGGGDQSPMSGMVGLQYYGRLLLQHYGFHTGEAAEAFRQAAPYALHQVVEKLAIVGYEPDSYVPGGGIPGPSSVDFEMSTQRLKLSPFPDYAAISRAFRLLFEEDLQARILTDVETIFDIPAMVLHMEAISKNCLCASCGNDKSARVPCNWRLAQTNFALIIADVLTLSLFECPESLRVSLGFNRSSSVDAQVFASEVRLMLVHGIMRSCSVTGVLEYALNRAGHSMNTSYRNEQGPSWVMSSFKGQAIWPTIYETQAWAKRGYLSLSWLPGVLRYNEEVYTWAYNPSSIFPWHLGPFQTAAEYVDEVLHPANLASDTVLGWHVALDEHGLRLLVTSHDKHEKSLMFQTSPFTAINSLAQAVLVEDCAHDPNASLDTAAQYCTFTSPLRPTRGTTTDQLSSDASSSNDDDVTQHAVPLPSTQGEPTTDLDSITRDTTEDAPEGPISVVAVDGSDELRFLALCANGRADPFVLRKQACLACCLEVCRQTGYTTLVL